MDNEKLEAAEREIDRFFEFCDDWMSEEVCNDQEDGEHSADDCVICALAERKMALRGAIMKLADSIKTPDEKIISEKALPDMRKMKSVINYERDLYYVKGWNACRAEMLKAKE